MTTYQALRNDLSSLIAWSILLFIPSILIVGLVLSGITVNQSIAIIISLVIITIWFHNRFAGLMAALLFIASKALWVRATYFLDLKLGQFGFDLLGISPALLLAALIIIDLFYRFSAGEKIAVDRTRGLLIAFAGISAFSIINPANSPLIGLAGFERNILPNMLILFLCCSIIRNERDFIKFAKVLLTLGIISTLYAIAQYWFVLFPWEKEWYRQIALTDGLTGWLTIGLRGIEFRVFSIFYGYMDFFFTNVLIFGIALGCKGVFDGRWKWIRIIYFISWFTILFLSLERMPFIMSIIIIIMSRYLHANPAKRRRIISLSVGIITAGIVALSIASPILKSTGADKLIRLAELANPFGAKSINDRVETKWGPALEIIKANPLGVGIGYGSQTKARGDAEKAGLFVQPHNELLQKTLETGILGGLIFILLQITILKSFLNIRNSGALGLGLGISMVGITISYWVCGLVNLPFSGNSGLYFWAVAGAALGIKDNIVSKLNEPKLKAPDADKQGGRLVQDETTGKPDGTRLMISNNSEETNI